jgi:hypothetical protein
MSLNALASQELRRRAGARPGTRPQPGAVAEGVRAAPEPDERGMGNALAALVNFIPTEVVTLYVAALSAQQPLLEATGFFDARWILWSFAGLTPALLLLIYVSKVAASGARLPGPGAWPWWKMCAATVAFIVWALAVPGNPYLSGAASAVAGLGAMLTSSLLQLMTPIFERPLPAGSADGG